MPPRMTEEQHIKKLTTATEGRCRFDGWASEARGARARVRLVCLTDGHEWAPTMHQAQNGTGCPMCARVALTAKVKSAAAARAPKVSEAQYIERITAKGEGRYEFLGWDGDYNKAASRAQLRCIHDGHEWSTSIGNLLNTGSGCSKCHGNNGLDQEGYASEVAFVHNGSIKIASWVGAFHGRRSRVVCQCQCGHEWETLLMAVAKGTGCPCCSGHGYNPAKPGTLYALRSTCGSMVKVGITNDHKRRLGELKKATPFEWECIELVTIKDGSLIAQAEKEIHAMTTQAPFPEAFKGYTEWRLWDDRIPQWYKDASSKAA